MIPFARYRHSPCSLGLSATSQQYFSLTTNQPPATSNQPAVLFSQNKPAPAISHQPTEHADCFSPSTYLKMAATHITTLCPTVMAQASMLIVEA
jgi:hypothetical protein